MTHEEFIHAVRRLVIRNFPQASILLEAKLVYGVGQPGSRGTCLIQAWKQQNKSTALIEISASSEVSSIQLAGTTIHELAHAYSMANGNSSGHTYAWRGICQAMGLYNANVKHEYFRHQLHGSFLNLVDEDLEDGGPSFRGKLLTELGAVTTRPCALGIGSRGGKSRGLGSGSRLRLYECACPYPVKIRHAGDSLGANCNKCKRDFQLRR